MRAPPDATACKAFVELHTTVSASRLVPDLRLRLATELTPLWQVSQTWLDDHAVPPPFWAFAWAGGEALARHLLDHPELVAGRRVLDFASGSGIVAIAAARCGAASVSAVDIDPFAAAAIRCNAALNGVAIQVVCKDCVGEPLDEHEVILAGDVCYDRGLAEQVAPWFRRLAARGKRVLLGDPDRAYGLTEGVSVVGERVVPTSLDLEGRLTRVTRILALNPPLER